MNKKESKLKAAYKDPAVFAEVFLRVPEGPKMGQPLTPGYCERRIYKAYQEHDRVAMCVHRRGRKTTTLCAIAIHRAVTKPFSKVLVIAPAGSHVTNFFNTLDSMIRLNSDIEAMVETFSRHSSPTQVTLTNGSKIIGFTTGARSRGEGKSIRGQSADLVIIDEAAYLAEEDFRAIKPIYTGDIARYQAEGVKILAASTLNYESNTFSDWIGGEESTWEAILIPVTENEDIPSEVVEEWKLEYSELEWDVEYLCKLSIVGAGVFRKAYVERALHKYHYYEVRPKVGNIRVMGIDWNSVSAGTHLLVVELDRKNGKHYILNHEEIPPSEFRMQAAVKRVVRLNEIYAPHYIYADRGYGADNIEQIRAYGKENPDTGLYVKVIPVDFGSSYEALDPISRMKVTRPMKQVMVHNGIRIFEDERIVISANDQNLYKSLVGYKMKQLTHVRSQYFGDDDHAVDALLLALWGIHEKFDDPCAARPAVGTHLLTLAEPSEATRFRQDNLTSRLSLIPLSKMNPLSNRGGNIMRVGSINDRGGRRDLGSPTRRSF